MKLPLPFISFFLLASTALLGAVDAPVMKSAEPPPVTVEPAKPKRKAERRKAADPETLRPRIAAAFAGVALSPDIVYKRVADQALQLDLLTPRGLTAAAAPVLVYIHGGGWSAGDR